MGNEVSQYLTAVNDSLNMAYGRDWNISLAGFSPTSSEKAYQVELSVEGMSLLHSGYEPFVRVNCAATALYVSKAATHGSIYQAADIAATLARYIHYRTFGEGTEAAIIGAQPLLVYSEDGYPTGEYDWQISWEVDLIVTDSIDIPGYTTTNPPDPFEGRPDFPDSPDAPTLEGVELDPEWRL